MKEKPIPPPYIPIHTGDLPPDFIAWLQSPETEQLADQMTMARNTGATVPGVLEFALAAWLAARTPKVKKEEGDCPHATFPFRFCNGCKADPCPIGLHG